MISLIKILENSSYFISTENRLVVVWALEGRGEKETTMGHEITFGGDGFVHYLYCDDVFCVHICQNITNCTLNTCSQL